MKFLLTFVALIAVAVAQPVKRPTPGNDNFSVAPSPVVFGPISPDQPAPLVQLIVNVNQAAFNPVSPAPVAVPSEIPASHPVIVVDQPTIVDQQDIVPEPVIVVEQPEVEPIQVIDVIPVEPVIVGTPILPSPAVVLPDILN